MSAWLTPLKLQADTPLREERLAGAAGFVAVGFDAGDGRGVADGPAAWAETDGDPASAPAVSDEASAEADPPAPSVPEGGSVGAVAQPVSTAAASAAVTSTTRARAAGASTLTARTLAVGTLCISTHSSRREATRPSVGVLPLTIEMTHRTVTLSESGVFTEESPTYTW